ncbi:hypothetical protein G3A_06990 [Bacillus sp. 17376]|uniref:Uncharacterized protein n=1 Tax=Mesobacillus boroniphilus JCM 21738 TaxID=1294265 RepID=W4RP53_9BACI|nr:hypothetical protein [Mesobacillus boroniphilus]ESU33258.1 hypothetical protein G3A_06990 [Bacillus sp. 17376]GAE46210.1 hypothetical protein JCM21738_3092 [Mesobacillus boroniphilus JCM 21738]
MRAKRILGIMVVSMFLIGLLGACDSSWKASDVTSVSNVQDNAVSEPGQVAKADMNTGSGSENPVPQELENIPKEYYQAADQQGTLVELTYDTYESKTYEQKSKKLTKRAIVYLPYGTLKKISTMFCI